MEIVNFTPWQSLAGGLLIGLAAAMLMLFNGKIAGISGITKGIISKDCPTPQERNWRIFFIVGIMLGGVVITMFLPDMTAKVHSFNYIQLIIAGLLVGVGTAIGNGCTSGHGVCGLGRRSIRSLASVLTFITAGYLTVYFMFHILKIGV